MTPEEMKSHGISPCAYGFEADPQIRVEWRDTDLWAITRGGACYNRLGEWEYEPLSSSRTEEFFERCRYPLDEALRVAVKAVEEEVAIRAELMRRREENRNAERHKGAPRL